MPSPFEALELPFMRAALAELLLLAVAGGLIGSWIVLRRIAFFSHAAGSATFPGLVIADATGFSAPLAAAAAAGCYAGGVDAAGRRGRAPGDAATALVLVACLAGGVVLASDVLDSDGGVGRLLFGTLVGLDTTDVAIAAAAALVAAGASLALGRAWLASAFDPDTAATIGLPRGLVDALLLWLVALVVVASLSAVGTLLVSALFVVPAATARLFARTVRGLLAGAVAIGAGVGALGLYLAYWLDVPPGPGLAVLGASVYAAAATTRGLRRRIATATA